MQSNRFRTILFMLGVLVSWALTGARAGEQYRTIPVGPVSAPTAGDDRVDVVPLGPALPIDGGVAPAPVAMPASRATIAARPPAVNPGVDPAEWQPRPPGWERGVVKVGSAPIRCQVSFDGKVYQKEKAVMTLEGVPAGNHRLEFRHGDKTVVKTVTVKADQTAHVFGNLLVNAREFRRVERSFKDPISVPRGGQRAYSAQSIAEADALFAQAQDLQNAANPFKKTDRYFQAETLYQQLLEKHPQSDKVEATHFHLGLIYESVYIRHYSRAIEKYKELIALNFNAPYPVRWRIGVLLDNRFGDHGAAREWFELSAKHDPESVRARAEAKVEELKRRGF